jgi:hypothetical protein
MGAATNDIRVVKNEQFYSRSVRNVRPFAIENLMAPLGLGVARM